MHISRHIVQELVYEFGAPSVERWEVPLTEPEFREVERHVEHGRAHDVSLLILKDDQVAVVRKPSDPSDAFCVPTGSIDPEESFVDGAARIALEETGLAVRVHDYLLQIHASFTLESEKVMWSTHAMLARTEGGSIGPRNEEGFEAAKWIALDDLAENVNPLLEASGLGELRYRSRIHRRFAEILGERDAERG